MQHDPDSNTLTWLLSRLQLGSSVHDATTVDLLRKLLSKEDYVNIAGELKHASDAKNLLDFMLHSLHERCLSSPDTAIHLNRRARRLMIKIVSKMPVMPSSLFVTGVNVPANREYIGGGGFGHILKGELRGEAVALKVLYKTDNDVAFCREALMWRSLDHNLVLPFLGIHEDESASQFFLVSPYMKNGTLAQWRKKENPSVVHIEERMLELAHGIEYIHSEGIVHGDLRGANILLDDELHVQIADFGLTRLSEATNTQSGALHLNFAAPELFGFSDNDDSTNDTPARTQMSDVYAFGCVYYEIHFDSRPFAGKHDIQIWTLISRGILPPLLHEPPLSDEAWDMIQRCWIRKPEERPRIEDVAQRMMALYQSAITPTNARNLFYSEMLRKLSLPPLTSNTQLKNNARKRAGKVIWPEMYFFSLAKYNEDVMTYVHQATSLPLSRDEYLADLGTQTVPEQFESYIEPILQVYQDMQSHCTNYERKTHPLIIRLALSIAGYSSNGDYSAICNDIKKMEAGSSQEALKLNRNIKTITGFINDSRDAKDKLKAFEVETSQDFIAADEKTKKLDAVVRVYEEDITKEFDSIEGTKRIIDIPSNAFNQFFARRAARKQAEASQSVLGHLTEVKENGDAMKVNLQEIRDLADNAQKAIEALIGGLENVSEQLEDIKKIVLNTDLRKARGFVVEFLESNLLERWKAVGELAREFVLDAHLS